MAASLGLFGRVHGALMPDYNRRAAAYWWAIAAAGSVALAFALVEAARAGPGAWLRIGLGCVATALAAAFPIRLPRTAITFAAGEAFIFLLLLLLGPAAATVAAACEAAVGASRSSRRWTSRIASPAIAAIAMTATGHAFVAMSGALGERAMLTVPLAVSVFAAGYGLTASVLVALVPLLKRDGPIAWIALVRSASSFGGMAAVHAASALVGGLLFLLAREYGEPFLAQTIVIVTLMITTAHFFSQHQAAESAAKSALLEASEAAAREAQRHAAELADSQALFHGSFADAAIAMALLDSRGFVREANAAMVSLVGLPPDRVVGASFALHVDEGLESAGLRSHLLGGQEVSPQALNTEFIVRGAGQRRLRVASRCSRLNRPPGVEPCLIVQMQDITAQRDAEAELRRMAYEDVLTGLPNRRSLLECMDLLARQSTLPEARPHALVLLDLDRFKLINDTFGHAAGDQLLRLLAERIRTQIGPADHVARLGGDEFGVVLRSVPDEDAAVATAQRIQLAVAEPLRLSGELIHPSVSVGVALGTAGGAGAMELIRHADLAMYQSKRAGGNGVTAFDSHHEGTTTTRLKREPELREAISTGTLRVAYQPICTMAGAFVGLEALLRWTLPSGEEVQPVEFVPLAEEIGLMTPLTDFVLAKASRQFSKWLDVQPSWCDARIHVNVGGGDLIAGTLVERVAHILADAALEPRHLAIEVTESTSMAHFDVAARTLQQLHDLGVHVCIDDFGAGQSSLSCLSRLPVHCLKIDRSFIAALERGVHETEVVRAVIALGVALQMEVVAKGIETRSQWQRLAALGCGFGQGHLVAPALDAGEIQARYLGEPVSAG
jgi:diguanylate cyclase (GGDEF)-like protein/PAS domain S-box-containing protein